MPETIKRQSEAAELILFPGCDPKNRLTDLFASNQIASKPELVILNWLVSLPTAIDPAFAAQSLLIKLDKNLPQLSDDQKSILTLLGEIARHPRKKLLNQTSENSRAQRRRHWLRQTHQRTRH